MEVFSPAAGLLSDAFCIRNLFRPAGLRIVWRRNTADGCKCARRAWRRAI